MAAAPSCGNLKKGFPLAKNRIQSPTMKYLPLLLIAALLTACDTSEEDRNFYYNGWMKPETDANKRIYGGEPTHVPVDPVDTQ